MKVCINGEWKESDTTTLAALIESYQLEKDIVVTDVEGEIVGRERWKSFQLQDGMTIEIVQFVGGG